MNRATPSRLIPNARMTDTLAAMKRLASEGKKDLEVRRLVEQLNANVAEGDYASELLSVYYWVKQNIRYMRDPAGVEMLKTPRKLLETKAGDCDDIATLLAAMYMALGNTVQFAIASFRPGAPAFSHVFVEVITPWGPVVFDPVANRVTGEMLGNIQHKKAIPLGVGDMGAGVGSLGRLAAHISPGGGGNVYSVFDYHRNLYDYYEAPTGMIPATGRFRKPVRTMKFGIVPKDLAASFPSGARKIGSGPDPRGIIAAKNGSPSLLGALRMPSRNTLLVLGVGVLIGVYGVPYLKKRMR